MKALPVIIILALASLCSVGLTWLNFSVTAYQQLIVLLMIISFILFGWLSPRKHGQLFSYGVLFISALLIQLLINSSGSFYSPFLVLFNFYILGLAFLVSLTASISFVIFGGAALLYELFGVPANAQLFASDPGTAILYMASFIVIIPFAHYVATKYRVKDELAKLLTREVKVGESIIQSMHELVVVTDLQLHITSANDAVEKIYKQEKAVLVGKSLFDVVTLKEISGETANLETLSVDKVLTDRSTRIINNLLLYTPSRIEPYRVSVQVRPVIDQNDKTKIDQLTFVINESNQLGQEGEVSPDLQKAIEVEQNQFNNLVRDVGAVGRPKLTLEVMMVRKTEEDIAIFRELETKPLSPKTSLVNLVELSEQLVNLKQPLARAFGTYIGLNLPEDPGGHEINLIKLAYQSGNRQQLAHLTNYSALVDPHWIQVLLAECLDLAILLSDGEQSPITVELRRSGSEVAIECQFKGLALNPSQVPLFTKYYNGVKLSDHLEMGSGLEGYLIKVISLQLNVPIEFTISKEGFWRIGTKLARVPQATPNLPATPTV